MFVHIFKDNFPDILDIGVSSKHFKCFCLLHFIQFSPSRFPSQYTDNDGYYVIPFCSAWKEHGQHGTVQLGTYTEGTVTPHSTV